MARSYGKIPRTTKKAATAQSAELQINIAGRHTLEQLSLELSKAIAQLQDHGVFGVQKFRARLEPLDEKAAIIALADEDGEPLIVIDVPPIPKAKPFRENDQDR